MATQKNSKKAIESIQYFKLVDEKSSKFWEISIGEARVSVRYGKIGTTGQSQTKEFATGAAAALHANKLVAEKLVKGYLKSKAVTASGDKAPQPVDQEPKAAAEASKRPKKAQPEIAVKVARSEIVKKQIQMATALQKEILDDAQALFPDEFKADQGHSDIRCFAAQIQLSAESFDVTFQPCNPQTVDRTASMLSGPFFTSKKFPIPTVNKEMLYPIVQIDLQIASALISEPLGDGLLQLWYDINADEGIVRVIPRSELTVDKETGFEFVPAKNFDGFPLPVCWGSDPNEETVLVMSKYKSTGISTQAEYPEIYLNDADEEYEVPKSLFKLVKKFNHIAPDKSSSAVHMFGTFSPIQYSAADVACKCLFHIAGDWGSSGNAQVFYKIDKKGGVSFQFLDSLR